MVEAIRYWDIALGRGGLYLCREEKGQDLVEYALLIAILTISVIAIILLIGPNIGHLFQYVENQLGTV